MTDIDVSVVIGFKDWGIGRLTQSVLSIKDAFGDLRGEVIVSDYGSEEHESTMAALEPLGVKYVYTRTDGVWSRSRALNAGFAASTGKVLISTDADMVFSPGSLGRVAEVILANPSTACLLQCRDLPPTWTDSEIATIGADWAEFERVSRRRERWGMGGMAAVHRDAFLKIRGYDERMQVYGGEDIDFASRLRRAGCRLHWVEEPSVRMYHMWHPSTAARHELSPEESAQVAYNKAIMRDDKTFVRNVLEWKHRPVDAPPLVSVVISTYQRAHLIADSINSVLAQSVQDFEIIIVDDGSTDETEDVVRSFRDDRIVYLRQANAGVAAARNAGVRIARGAYIAVLDDDDLSVPWRLEAQFSALAEGVSATFGSSMNFDDETGALTLHAAKVFTEATTADKGGAPAHSTWMVERQAMLALGYDESLDSGIDNDFALRSLRAGLTWAHTGTLHTLRRMHGQQITGLKAKGQASTARRAYEQFTYRVGSWRLAKLREERGKQDFVPLRRANADSALPYLPDHLVTRRYLSEESDLRDADFVIETGSGARVGYRYRPNFTWAEIAALGGRLDEAHLIVTQGREASIPTPGQDSIGRIGAKLAREGYFARTDGAMLLEQVCDTTVTPVRSLPRTEDHPGFVRVLGPNGDMLWRGTQARPQALPSGLDSWVTHAAVQVRGRVEDVVQAAEILLRSSREDDTE